MPRSLPPLLLIVGAVVGCAANTRLAPPVDQALVARAEPTDLGRDDLEAGRQTYLTDCARCHRPVAVTAHDPAGWAATLDRMVPLTGLDPDQEARLRAYLEAASGSD